MASMDGRNPQGPAHPSPTLSPSPQQEPVKPAHESATEQTATSIPQQTAISEVEKTLEESTLEESTLQGSTEAKKDEHSSCDAIEKVQDDDPDQKNENENSPKDTEDAESEADTEEGSSKYHPGGFHPVYIDDVYDNRYKILNKIGYGVYSTVWLVKDLQQE